MLVISSICVLLLLKRVEIDQLFQSHLQFSEVMRPISGQYKVIGNNVYNKKAQLIKKIISDSVSIFSHLPAVEAEAPAGDSQAPWDDSATRGKAP